MLRIGPLAIVLLLSLALPAQTTPVLTPLQMLRQQIDRGHGVEALAQLDVLAQAKPIPEGVDRLRGIALYTLGRFEEASIALKAALVRMPKDTEATQMLGLTLYRLGRPADAIPLLEAASTWTETTTADPSYVLALCYLDAQRYDDVRHAFATQYGFKPDSAQAYLLAARLLLRRDRVPIAQEFARKAIALDAGLPLAHALLGEVALAGNHLDEAIAEFETERVRNPLDGSVYDRLGDTYTRKGELLLAQQALERALLLEPTATGPYILLGKVLLKKGDAVNAQTYLERAVKMDPANYISHSLLGQTYRALGRTDDATRETRLSQSIQTANEARAK